MSKFYHCYLELPGVYAGLITKVDPTTTNTNTNTNTTNTTTTTGTGLINYSVTTCATDLIFARI